MRKLSLLILILMMSLQGISKQDTTVCLQNRIAKEVIKDLIRGDAASKELEQTKILLDLSEQKLSLKDDIIKTKDEQIKNQETIIKETESQKKLEREKSDELLKELKKERKKVFFHKLGSGGLLIVVVTLLLTGN